MLLQCPALFFEKGWGLFLLYKKKKKATRLGFRILRQNFYNGYWVIISVCCYSGEEMFRREENASLGTLFACEDLISFLVLKQDLSYVIFKKTKNIYHRFKLS